MVIVCWVYYIIIIASKVKNALFPKMLCLVDLSYPSVIIGGERKFHINNPEKFIYCMTTFLFALYKYDYIFAQIVTITFSDRPKGKQENCPNCDVTKSKSWCGHDVIYIITLHNNANLIFHNRSHYNSVLHYYNQ